MTLAALLVEGGFRASAQPGFPVRLEKGDPSLEPFVAIQNILEGKLDELAWADFCVGADITLARLSGR